MTYCSPSSTLFTLKKTHIPETPSLPAFQALSGDRGFLTKARLSKYEEKRNDPCVPDALSGLSPYLHFGHLAPQRAAIEAAKMKPVHKVGGADGVGWAACWAAGGLAGC